MNFPSNPPIGHGFAVGGGNFDQAWAHFVFAVGGGVACGAQRNQVVGMVMRFILINVMNVQIATTGNKAFVAKLALPLVSVLNFPTQFFPAMRHGCLFPRLRFFVLNKSALSVAVMPFRILRPIPIFALPLRSSSTPARAQRGGAIGFVDGFARAFVASFSIGAMFVPVLFQKAAHISERAAKSVPRLLVRGIVSTRQSRPIVFANLNFSLSGKHPWRLPTSVAPNIQSVLLDDIANSAIAAIERDRKLHCRGQIAVSQRRVVATAYFLFLGAIESFVHAAIILRINNNRKLQESMI